jgi:hypothetical protein
MVLCSPWTTPLASCLSATPALQAPVPAAPSLL